MNGSVFVCLLCKVGVLDFDIHAVACVCCCLSYVQYVQHNVVELLSPSNHRLYTCKWIGNATYIVYVTSLASLRTVTARGKLAGVTNDKESVLL